MKKIILIAFFFFIFLAPKVFAERIEVKKCFENDGSQCEDKIVSIGLEVNNAIGSNFECVNLPLMDVSRNKSIENAKGTSFKYSLSYPRNLKKCKAFIDKSQRKKLQKCADLFFKGVRIDCVKDKKIFVYKPYIPIIYRACINSSTNQKTIIPSFDGKKRTCEMLENKYWASETLFGFRYSELNEINYSKVLNKNIDKNKQVSQEKKKTKEKEAQDNILKPISKPEF